VTNLAAKFLKKAIPKGGLKGTLVSFAMPKGGLKGTKVPFAAPKL
jgi:hypothetical protein